MKSYAHAATRYFIGSQPSPITLQNLPKYLSLPTEKIDVDAANDVIDDLMSRIYINDDGQLEISTIIHDNLSIMAELNEDNFSTFIASPEDCNDYQ